MRTDPNRTKGFTHSSAWHSSGKLSFIDKDSQGKTVSNSFSGNEKNHFFLNQQGKAFTDLSTLSGMNLPADGRSFALFDYDRDGWLDLALVSVNAPRLQIFRNQMSHTLSEPQHHLSLHLLGGNHTAQASDKLSNRDGYGAKIEALLDTGTTLYREHQCGAGMAAQNSNTVHIGIGTATKVRKLTVSWPSGQQTTLENLRPGGHYKATEDKDVANAL